MYIGETREGWPLLTVETEANGNVESTIERGPSLDGSLACRGGTRYFCPALAALVSPVPYFFSSLPDTLYLSPSPSNLGMQSCRVACLLICDSGVHYSLHIYKPNLTTGRPFMYHAELFSVKDQWAIF